MLQKSLQDVAPSTKKKTRANQRTTQQQLKNKWWLKRQLEYWNIDRNEYNVGWMRKKSFTWRLISSLQQRLSEYTEQANRTQFFEKKKETVDYLDENEL